jgi:hypothetical protein
MSRRLFAHRQHNFGWLGNGLQGPGKRAYRKSGIAADSGRRVTALSLWADEDHKRRYRTDGTEYGDSYLVVEFRSYRPAIFCAMCITSLRLALTEIVTQTGWTKGRAFYGQKVSLAPQKSLA